MPLRHRRSSLGVAPRPDARLCLKNRSPSVAVPPVFPALRSVCLAFIAARLWLSFTPGYLIQMVFSLLHHPLLPLPQHVVTDIQIPGHFTQLLALQHSSYRCYLEFSAELPMSILCCSHEPLLS